MTGGDAGLGALAGGIGGAIGGAVGFKTLKWDLPGRVAAQVISGSVSGGIASVINGGNFWQGMAWGAAGAAIASGIGAVIEIAAQTQSDHAEASKAGPVGEEAAVVSGADDGYADVIPAGSSVNATFWAAIAKGDLATATEALFAAQQLGTATPAMVRALEVAQRAAELMPRIVIKAHGFREGRLGSLTMDNARQAIANVIAKGNIKVWMQGGQRIFAGQFAQGRQIFSFTGSFRPNGVIELAPLCGASIA